MSGQLLYLRLLDELIISLCFVYEKGIMIPVGYCSVTVPSKLNRKHSDCVLQGLCDIVTFVTIKSSLQRNRPFSCFHHLSKLKVSSLKIFP